jgi:serine/threonine-protein kinase RsbW
MTNPRTTPAPIRVTLHNQRPLIDRFEEGVLAECERVGYSKASLFAIRLALDEAITNGFSHGHEHLPPTLPIFVEYAIDQHQAYFAVEDQGPGFDPSTVKDPTLDENLEQMSGRGVILIRAYMSSVTHNSKGNRIEMVYRRPGA